MSTQYGIYDTQDDCWVGGDDGPKTFDELIMARIAAQLFEDQICGSDLGGRFVAKEISQNDWKLKDQLEVKRDTLSSLRRIEGRKQ